MTEMQDVMKTVHAGYKVHLGKTENGYVVTVKHPAGGSISHFNDLKNALQYWNAVSEDVVKNN